MKTPKLKDNEITDNMFNDICFKLTEALNAIAVFQRRFHPVETGRLREDLIPVSVSLKQIMLEIDKPNANHELIEPLNVVNETLSLIINSLETIIEAPVDDFRQTVIQVMRSFRKICKANEKLYPIRMISPYLNRFFLEPGAYERPEILNQKQNTGVLTGLNHFGAEDNEYERGSMTIYVPEWYDDKIKWPVVMALHGGNGHGRDFVWTWLREARSRGFILVAPTSKDQTWSIMDPQIDGTSLISAIDFLKKHYNFNMKSILLTGISDGGTFAMMLSLKPTSPFTAFAPVAGVLPPLNLDTVKGKRIYWAHGALDWMFPVIIARRASEALKMAGADVTLRVIDDLSHTYPREENDAILKWFDPSLAL